MADTGNFYVGCYWGDRWESADECAARILRLTSGLADIDPAFASWEVVRPQGGEVASDATWLGKLMEARDPDRGDSAFVLSLVSWQQGKHEGAAVRATCGGAGGAPGVVNSVVLRPVYEGYGHEPWLRDARRILEVAVSAFEPDRAAMLTPEYREAQPSVPRAPLAGAVTYLDGWRGVPPRRIEAEKLGRGWLFDLIGGTASLPDVGEVLRLRETLGSAGMLQATPQVQPGSSELRG